MSLQEAAKSAASGDNTVSHVASAATIGGALASITSWILQLNHIMPTPEVTAAFGVIFAVAASWLMMKISG